MLAVLALITSTLGKQNGVPGVAHLPLTNSAIKRLPSYLHNFGSGHRHVKSRGSMLVTPLLLSGTQQTMTDRTLMRFMLS